MIFKEELSIDAVPPFNFELSAQIFKDGDEQICRFENDMFWQVVRIAEKTALVCIKSAGSIDKPKLTALIESKHKLTGEDVKYVSRFVTLLFNLGFDLNEFYREARNDKTMASLTVKLYGLKNPTTQFAFEALIDSIVEQQISLKVANAFERKIIKKWGQALKLDGKTYYAYSHRREHVRSNSAGTSPSWFKQAKS